MIEDGTVGLPAAGRACVSCSPSRPGLFIDICVYLSSFSLSLGAMNLWPELHRAVYAWNITTIVVDSQHSEISCPPHFNTGGPLDRNPGGGGVRRAGHDNCRGSHHQGQTEQVSRHEIFSIWHHPERKWLSLDDILRGDNIANVAWWAL